MRKPFGYCPELDWFTSGCPWARYLWKYVDTWPFEVDMVFCQCNVTDVVDCVVEGTLDEYEGTLWWSNPLGSCGLLRHRLRKLKQRLYKCIHEKSIEVLSKYLLFLDFLWHFEEVWDHIIERNQGSFSRYFKDIFYASKNTETTLLFVSLFFFWGFMLYFKLPRISII